MNLPNSGSFSFLAYPLALLLGACSSTIPTIEPTVVSWIPHDPTAFTQGLLFHDGYLYESTGLKGQSELKKVSPKNGQSEKTIAIADFGEGLAKNGRLLTQLTWQAGIAYNYDIETFEPLAPFSYEGVGWGLCHDGNMYIMSSGSDKLIFRDHEFQPIGSIVVTDNGNKLKGINELECVGKHIYANVYGHDFIYKIEKQTGEVALRFDFKEIAKQHRNSPRDILNGIAHDKVTDQFYVTGKNWNRTYVVELKETDTDDER